MEKRGMNPAAIRRANQALVLHEIRNTGSLSRIQLARKLHLSAPSISANLDKLISMGLVKEIGFGESASSGRKPIMLHFNNTYGYILAVDLLWERARVILSDLSGEKIIDTVYIENATFISRQIIGQIMAGAEALVARNKMAGRKLLCVCVASPGVADPKTGEYVDSPRIADFRQVNFAPLFGQRFGVPVIVKNDISLATLGEMLAVPAADRQDFIHLFVGMGLGYGAVVNGQLYDGGGNAIDSWSHGRAIVNLDAAIEDGEVAAGNILNNRVSIFGIIEGLLKTRPEVFSEAGQAFSLETIPEYKGILYGALDREEAPVLKAVKKSAGLLAGFIYNICSFLGITCAVLSGDLCMRLGERYTGWVNDALRRYDAGGIRAELSKTGYNAAIYGGLHESVEAVLQKLL